MTPAFDSDDGEHLSGWEEDSPTDIRYLVSLPDVFVDPSSILLFSNAKPLSEVEDEDVVYMEDLATRYVGCVHHCIIT